MIKIRIIRKKQQSYVHGCGCPDLQDDSLEESGLELSDSQVDSSVGKIIDKVSTGTTEEKKDFLAQNLKKALEA